MSDKAPQCPELPQADGRVLSQVLAAEEVLLSLANPAQIAELCAQHLSLLPGVLGCRVRLGESSAVAGTLGACPAEGAGQPGSTLVRIGVHGREFGTIEIGTERNELFAPYEPLVRHCASFIALAWESRFQTEIARRAEEERDAANRELETFAHSASHDLRGPLHHISGFLGLLERRLGPGLDEQGRRCMDIILDSSKRMERLIDDILSFSRLGRQPLSLVRVELNEMVRDVLRELDPSAHGRAIQWNIAELPAVTGDPRLLRVVLLNLVSNALKFTRPRAHTEISIGRAASPDREVIVFVRDNGVGFDPRYIDKLFGAFQRLHRVEDFEGTGMGLANVRRIIARHGGRTWADGGVDQGATFYFSLPSA
jgi:signal transduction histidine kinase